MEPAVVRSPALVVDSLEHTLFVGLDNQVGLPHVVEDILVRVVVDMGMAAGIVRDKLDQLGVGNLVWTGGILG